MAGALEELRLACVERVLVEVDGLLEGVAVEGRDLTHDPLGEVEQLSVRELIAGIELELLHRGHRALNVVGGQAADVLGDHGLEVLARRGQEGLDL